MISDRRLSAVITVAAGQNGDTVGEIVTLDNHRMSADIQIYGGASMGEMDCRIYGVSLALMNKLTTTGPVMNQFMYQSKIQVLASNNAGGKTSIFSGNIAYAYADLNSSPEVSLIIKAFAGYNLTFKPASVISYAKPVAVATLVQNIATAAGLRFENHGVNGTMPPCYYDKTMLDQLRAIAEDAGINWEIYNDILYIWPRNGALTDPAQEVTVGKNMVGYPVFSSSNVVVKAEFLPFMRIGGKAKVSGSMLTGANGTWAAFTVSHELDSITPGGRWFTTISMQTRY